MAINKTPKNMKKLMLAALLAGASLSVQAQDAKVTNSNSQQKQKPSLSPEDRAVRQVRRMTGPAQLSNEQIQAIRPILVEREKERDAIKNAAASDMKKQLKALNEKYETKLKASIKPEQWQSWEKFREEQKQNRKQGNAPKQSEQDQEQD
jgi:hypothetical protein